jgi:hypothetical protein
MLPRTADADPFLSYLERHYRCAEPVPLDGAGATATGEACHLYERTDAPS